MGTHNLLTTTGLCVCREKKVIKMLKLLVVAAVVALTVAAPSSQLDRERRLLFDDLINKAKESAMNLIPGLNMDNINKAISALQARLNAGSSQAACIQVCDADLAAILGDPALASLAHDAACEPLCKAAIKENAADAAPAATR